MSDLPSSLCSAAIQVLLQADPQEKVRLSKKFSGAWASGSIKDVGIADILPDRPARPARPKLKPPDQMARRSTGEKGRVALIHAIAHIELNAIDLAWDAIARFAGEDLPRAYFSDWVQVAVEEARHFQMLEDRLTELGAAYGDLPAHDGLWEAALKTADDVLARLALVPMVLEARGLDTAPHAADRFRASGDEKTAAILDEIAFDEIAHVAAGVRWFEHVCASRGLNPVAHFHGLVAERYKGQLKAPFAHDLRKQAKMAREYYDY